MLCRNRWNQTRVVGKAVGVVDVVSCGILGALLWTFMAENCVCPMFMYIGISLHVLSLQDWRQRTDRLSRSWSRYLAQCALYSPPPQKKNKNDNDDQILEDS